MNYIEVFTKFCLFTFVIYNGFLLVLLKFLFFSTEGNLCNRVQPLAVNETSRTHLHKHPRKLNTIKLIYLILYKRELFAEKEM